MPDSFIPYGPDPASPARRSATAKRPSAARDGTTDTFHHDIVIPTERRIITYHGSFASFAIPGSAALAQPILTIENTTGSGVIVTVNKLEFKSFAGAAAATIWVPPWAYTYRTTTMPTGGTTATKLSTDSRESSSANVTVRQGASADGTASAITSAFVAPRVSQAFGTNVMTAVGVMQPTMGDLLDSLPDSEILLQAGQALGVHVNTLAAADNATTRRHFVNIGWEEFTEF